jgi:hypothetical protein
MKDHDFLNLKMATIEQYSMVVKKKELDHWKGLGWLTFTEIGLPEGDEQAFLLYGRIKKSETLIFNRPTLLKNVSVDKLVGLEIREVVTHLGTYGMGGAGFFGLLLDNSEYLTYAVWGAENYVIIDGRVVGCSPDLYGQTKPWISNYGGDQTWDELTTYILGSRIESLSLTKDTCHLTLGNRDKKIEVTFVKNDQRLPRKVRRRPNAFRKGVISDYLLFQHENGTLIV